jgi:alkanesulfonate monooxygenase SsuD/methylene tetrahydromethanopterin reductase-like flavin-dependent oxidoreductase (luciferase family)
MQLGIHFVRFTWPGGPEAIGPVLGRAGRIADDAGVGHLSLMDHYFQMEALFPADEPMLEGYAGLAFLAAHTTNARLGLLVTGVTYRHPGLLAKIVTTLDVLSGGRAELGIGAAWYDREHLAEMRAYAALGVSRVILIPPGGEPPDAWIEKTCAPLIRPLAEL